MEILLSLNNFAISRRRQNLHIQNIFIYLLSTLSLKQELTLNSKLDLHHFPNNISQKKTSEFSRKRHVGPYLIQSPQIRSNLVTWMMHVDVHHLDLRLANL